MFLGGEGEGYLVEEHNSRSLFRLEPDLSFGEIRVNNVNIVKIGQKKNVFTRDSLVLSEHKPFILS